MTNYADAMQAKIDASATTISASNLKKANALVASLRNEALCAMLKADKIDAARFTRALYASEKTIKFAALATSKFVDMSKINENAHAAFATAMRTHDAKRVLTKRMIESALTKDVKCADADDAKCVFHRNATLSADTLNAQSQQVIDMLKTLNIISEKSARSQSYDVNMTELATALRKALNV